METAVLLESRGAQLSSSELSSMSCAMRSPRCWNRSPFFHAIAALFHAFLHPLLHARLAFLEGLALFGVNSLPDLVRAAARICAISAMAWALRSVSVLTFGFVVLSDIIMSRILAYRAHFLGLLARMVGCCSCIILKIWSCWASVRFRPRSVRASCRRRTCRVRPACSSRRRHTVRDHVRPWGGPGRKRNGGAMVLATRKLRRARVFMIVFSSVGRGLLQPAQCGQLLD